MYVCIYVYIYTYITYIHTYIYIYTYYETRSFGCISLYKLYIAHFEDGQATNLDHVQAENRGFAVVNVKNTEDLMDFIVDFTIKNY